MNTTFDYRILMAALFVLLSVLIVFFLCKWYLRRMKIISYPVAGMDWDDVVKAACLFLGSFIILSSLVEPVFQSYKVYASQEASSGALLSNILLQFSKLFMIVLAGIAFYFAFVRLFQSLLRYKMKDEKLPDDKNLPFAILHASVSVGMAIVVKMVVGEILLVLIPFGVNYSVNW